VVHKEKIQNLSRLAANLKKASSFLEKYAVLTQLPSVKSYLVKKSPHLSRLPLEQRIAALAVIAIGQEPIVFRRRLKQLKELHAIDLFYEDIGGIVGYHCTALQLLSGFENRKKLKYTRALGTDISKQNAVTLHAICKGIETLPKLAQIFPVGGLGIRLNLRTEEDEPLPAACLSFCGKTLLEGLVRDVLQTAGNCNLYSDCDDDL
jgi:hypothetical protein